MRMSSHLLMKNHHLGTELAVVRVAVVYKYIFVGFFCKFNVQVDDEVKVMVSQLKQLSKKQKNNLVHAIISNRALFDKLKLVLKFSFLSFDDLIRRFDDLYKLNLFKNYIDAYFTKLLIK
jgi:hypothetical protein